MKVKVKINNINKIIKDHNLEKGGKVNKHLRDTAERFMDSYIPMQTGIMKNSKQYPNDYSIKYVQPYSHYHYKGKKAVGASRPKGIKRIISNSSMSYRGAPKRGPEWDKRMMNDRKNDLCKDVENYIKRSN